MRTPTKGSATAAAAVAVTLETVNIEVVRMPNSWIAFKVIVMLLFVALLFSGGRRGELDESRSQKGRGNVQDTLGGSIHGLSRSLLR